MHVWLIFGMIDKSNVSSRVVVVCSVGSIVLLFRSSCLPDTLMVGRVPLAYQSLTTVVYNTKNPLVAQTTSVDTICYSDLASN